MFGAGTPLAALGGSSFQGARDHIISRTLLVNPHHRLRYAVFKSITC